VDVRANGMDQENPIVSNLPAVTMHWASPLTVDEAANQNRDVNVLLQSTEQSWLRTDTDVQPNPEKYPPYGFALEGEQQASPLAVAIRGSFESYFKDKPPFETEPMTDTFEASPGVVETSPESSRLVVIGSAEFVDDAVLELSRSLSADRYLSNLQFVQNAVDWSVEDDDLLTIRSRGTYARLLRPLDEGQKAAWMWGNYLVALVALVAISVVWAVRRRNDKPMFEVETVKGQGDSDE
jgi:ABC-2 type transport system permease protein